MSNVPGSEVSERWVEWRRTVDLVKYDQRWESMAARGENVHGEADAVTRLIERHVVDRVGADGPRVCHVLDAGCGTGRLAVELERRGHIVTAIDLDPDMVERARAKSSAIRWLVGDLAKLDDVIDADDGYDVIVMAGNILNFCAPGSQTAIVHNLVRHLAAGGLLVCGWSQELREDAYLWTDFVRDARELGANLAETWTNWDGDTMPVSTLGGEPVRSSDYAVIAVIKSS
ncbi:MAG: class I SAM-dependent methyltransferase [Actinobacteria bacterium]|nr:class I SAM-dependent methyltransferase [Actinomycetota bacterium]